MKLNPTLCRGFNPIPFSGRSPASFSAPLGHCNLSHVAPRTSHSPAEPQSCTVTSRALSSPVGLLLPSLFLKPGISLLPRSSSYAFKKMFMQFYLGVFLGVLSLRNSDYLVCPIARNLGLPLYFTKYTGTQRGEASCLRPHSMSETYLGPGATS